MYALRNIKKRSRNQCYRGKAVLNIMKVRLYPFLSYPACKANLFCGLSGSTAVFHINSKNGIIFSWQKSEHIMYFDFLCKSVLKISHFKKNSARYYHERTKVTM